MAVLLTGGAGYIGSHTALVLLENGYDIVVADDFSNSSPESVRRVEKLTGRSIKLYDVDVRDREALINIIKEDNIDSAIHFAGFKAVGESVEKPLEYYRNNLDSALSLLEAMKAYGARNVIFSSSASVYGNDAEPPIDESMPKVGITNPYAWTKAMIEQIIMDTTVAVPDMQGILLRYFNPVGAHESGLIGEDPNGIPNNLMPYITQVAVGKRQKLTVFGNDYDTPDGTPLRDYIHVMDLAEGHLKALDYMLSHEGEFDYEVFNLGTGTPYSVLDIVNAFIKVNGVDVPYVIGSRRAGDVPSLYANADKAYELLGWKTKRGLEDMMRDSWNWQKSNPEGYRG